VATMNLQRIKINQKVMVLGRSAHHIITGIEHTIAFEGTAIGIRGVSTQVVRDVNQEVRVPFFSQLLDFSRIERSGRRRYET
jgi:hypothetical protein